MQIAIPLPVYSFSDVHGLFVGPGGVIPFGMGFGSADEGITFEQTEDKNKMTVGAGGDYMHALIMNDSAKASIHLLKTSPLNAALTQMFAYQKTSSLFWGKNLLSVTNPATGDQNSGAGVAFTRRPSNSYAKDPNQLVWDFEIGALYVTLGAGVPAV
jgi:hypothetical protein